MSKAQEKPGVHVSVNLNQAPRTIRMHWLLLSIFVYPCVLCVGIVNQEQDTVHVSIFEEVKSVCVCYSVFGFLSYPFFFFC